MPGFVADASATLPWCFEEEATPSTEALLERLRAGEPAVVPAHWSTEVMNGLIMAVRRSRIDLDRVARFARDLAALPIRIEPPHAPAAWDAVIRVATKHHLTAYDATSPNGPACPSPLSTANCEKRRGPQTLFWWRHEHRIDGQTGPKAALSTSRSQARKARPPDRGAPVGCRDSRVFGMEPAKRQVTNRKVASVMSGCQWGRFLRPNITGWQAEAPAPLIVRGRVEDRRKMWKLYGSDQTLVTDLRPVMLVFPHESSPHSPAWRPRSAGLRRNARTQNQGQPDPRPRPRLRAEPSGSLRPRRHPRHEVPHAAHFGKRYRGRSGRGWRTVRARQARLARAALPRTELPPVRAVPAGQRQLLPPLHHVGLRHRRRQCRTAGRSGVQRHPASRRHELRERRCHAARVSDRLAHAHDARQTPAR